MKLNIAIVLVFFTLSGCGSLSDKAELDDLVLANIKGDEVNAFDSSIKASVYIFMAPDCPLCINYSLSARQIFNDHKNDSFKIFLVFPGEYYTKDEIQMFLEKYDLKMECLLDIEYELVHQLGAEVTPEGFLLNSDGKIVYHGAIDDWAYGPGLIKQNVNQHYLKDAINLVLNDHNPEIDFVQPYGCYIEL